MQIGMPDAASILARTLVAMTLRHVECQHSSVLSNISRKNASSSVQLRSCGIETSLFAGMDFPVAYGELLLTQVCTAARLSVMGCANLASFLNRLLAREGVLAALCLPSRGRVSGDESTTAVSRVAVGSSDVIASHKKQCR